MDYNKLSVERLLEYKQESEENIALYERTAATWNSFLGKLGLRSAIKKEKEKLAKINQALAEK